MADSAERLSCTTTDRPVASDGARNRDRCRALPPRERALGGTPHLRRACRSAARGSHTGTIVQGLCGSSEAGGRTDLAVLIRTPAAPKGRDRLQGRAHGPYSKLSRTSPNLSRSPLSANVRSHGVADGHDELRRGPKPLPGRWYLMVVWSQRAGSDRHVERSGGLRCARETS